LKAPLKKWQGITLRDGRVTTMNLSHMGLTGHLPEVIQYLDQLDTLILSKNEFSGPVPYVIGHLKNLVYLDLSDNNFQGAVPEAVNGLENLIFGNFQNNFFDSLPTITLNNLDSLNLENNKFSFNDLIPNLDAARDSVYYIPQKTIGDTVHYLAFNGEMFSYAWTGHDENIYQWYKAGNDTVISKADNLQFRLFTASDTGLYHCTYTNPNVPGLELTSAPVILKQHPALQIFPDSLAVGDNVADGTQLGNMYLNTNEPAWFEFIGESYCFDLQYDQRIITVSNLSEHDSAKQYDLKSIRNGQSLLKSEIRKPTGCQTPLQLKYWFKIPIPLKIMIYTIPFVYIPIRPIITCPSNSHRDQMMSSKFLLFL
jgi:hypothetical protein